MSGSFSRVLVRLMTRHRDARAGARAAVRLLDVGPSRLVEQLQPAAVVRQRRSPGNWLLITRPPRSNTRKMSPGGTVSHAGSGKSCGSTPLCVSQSSGTTGFLMVRGLARAGVGLAQHAALEREDPVVVGRAVEQHRPGRHQAALGRLDDRQVAGAAGFAHDAVVGRIHEPHERRVLAVEQRVRDLRVRRARLPFRGEARRDVRACASLRVSPASSKSACPCARPACSTVASPPWQSVQPSTTAGFACMVCRSVAVWQVTQPGRLGRRRRPGSACAGAGGPIGASGPVAAGACAKPITEAAASNERDEGRFSSEGEQQVERAPEYCVRLHRVAVELLQPLAGKERRRSTRSTRRSGEVAGGTARRPRRRCRSACC